MLSGVGVVNLTLGAGTTAEYAQLGNMSAEANYGNAHIYFSNGVQPAANIAANIAQAEQTNPGEPVDITETGYYTAVQSTEWGGVSQDVQAKETLNALFDAFKDGASVTYLYELMDTAANPSPTDREDTFGLFNEDGTPKEAATALHNLTTILADSGSTAQTFATGSLSYGLTGMPGTGNSMLMETSSGTYDLALWAEPTIWNETTESEVAAPSSNVTVSLGATYATVNVYDPLSGTAPIATYKGVSQITVALNDHPLIVQVLPATITSPSTPVVTSGASTVSTASSSSTSSSTTSSSATSSSTTGTSTTGTAVTSTAAPTLTVGSGPDTLALTINEDAYMGDAQFTVSVNGAQIGGTLTASALHSSGATQTVDILGNFPGAADNVSIDFLNDAYGGSAATDRNLYVTGATINGTTVPGASLALLTSGAQSFNFAGPAATGTATAGVLTVDLAEDAYQGNAEFTIAVDGTQIGGVMQVTALNSQGSSEAFTFADTLSAGTHDVAISFINDAYGGSAATDRNLYVTGVSYNGVSPAGDTASLFNDGTDNFDVTAPGTATAGATAAPPTLVVGAGADLLSLSVAEDAYLGNAQFTVSVDGVQIGGVMTASAINGTGSTQAVDVLGNFQAGAHTVTMNFLNDAWGGSASTDRNLYVTGATFNGTAVSGGAMALMTSGPESFNFSKPATSAPVSAQAPNPGIITVNLAEDAYQGNAQFTVSVDGTQLGGTQQVTALNSLGASQAFTFEDALAAGTHDIAVSFVNDAYGGSATTDRNLYVTGISYDTTAQAGSTASLLSNGTDHFSLVVPSANS